MKGIKEITEFKAVLENPLGFITSTDKEEIINQISNLFYEIAKMLFERYDILIYDNKGKEHYYSFAEVEFYYHKKGILDRDVDNCVYPRTCEAEKFLWHDTGVDICFKSECDIEDYYFGGILIRSLIDNDNKQIIGGPGRCANELAFLCRAGETPQLHLKKNVQQVKLFQTVRQGIKCDVDKDGKAKVKYCYFIEMKDRNWNRTEETIKMKSDFSGYIKETVTFRYPDNPENRDEKLKEKAGR
jgi:hypothetical protein